jgi:hypothetical protein
LLFLAALVLAFSKAGLLLCLVFLILYVLLEARPGIKIAALIFAIVTAYSVSTWSDVKVVAGYYDMVSNAVQGKAETTQIRIGHWNSFVDLVSEHPEYMIWGQGVGTSFYSEGRKQHVFNIELDHIDAIRQLGMLWFIAFSLLIAYIALRLVGSRKDNHRALGMSFISIYLAAGTNPVLITPLFMMLFATLYLKMKQDTPALTRISARRSNLRPS